MHYIVKGIQKEAAIEEVKVSEILLCIVTKACCVVYLWGARLKEIYTSLIVIEKAETRRAGSEKNGPEK